MTNTTIAEKPKRRQAEPTGPTRYCNCGRRYRDVRRGVTLIGLQAVGQSRILAGAPLCRCGRKLWRHALSTETPIHRCNFCRADLCLEELAEASKRDGHCHECKSAQRCPACEKRPRTWGATVSGVCYECDLQNTQRVRAAVRNHAVTADRAQLAVGRQELLCTCGKGFHSPNYRRCFPCGGGYIGDEAVRAGNSRCFALPDFDPRLATREGRLALLDETKARQ